MPKKHIKIHKEKSDLKKKGAKCNRSDTKNNKITTTPTRTDRSGRLRTSSRQLEDHEDWGIKNTKNTKESVRNGGNGSRTPKGSRQSYIFGAGFHLDVIQPENNNRPKNLSGPKKLDQIQPETPQTETRPKALTNRPKKKTKSQSTNHNDKTNRTKDTIDRALSNARVAQR